MKLIKYLKDVLKEWKMISFPDRRDVVLTSINIVVIISITIFFVFITDFSVSKIIKMLLGIR